MWIGVGFTAFSLSPSMWFLGGRELILDRNGFVSRWLWWRKRYEWTDIKSFETVGDRLQLPAGVVVVLHATGFLGLHRRFVIPDFFEIRKTELAAIMRRFHDATEWASSSRAIGGSEIHPE
jgi:hypothetical protein